MKNQAREWDNKGKIQRWRRRASSKEPIGVTRDGRNGSHCFFFFNITVIMTMTTTMEAIALVVVEAGVATTIVVATKAVGEVGEVGEWMGEVGVKSPALPNFYFLTNFFF